MRIIQGDPAVTIARAHLVTYSSGDARKFPTILPYSEYDGIVRRVFGNADYRGGVTCLKLVSEDLEHTQVISHDNHALGTAHAFGHVTAKTDLESVHQLGASAQRPRWRR